MKTTAERDTRKNSGANRETTVEHWDGTYDYTSREVVAVLPDEKSLDAAIDTLFSRGIDRAQISVLAERAMLPRSVTALEDDPVAPLGAYMSPSSRTEIEAASVGLPVFVAGVGSYALVLASGGSLAVALSALLLSGAVGGGIGGLLAHTIAKHHTRSIAGQIASGGLLVWVNPRTRAQEEAAIDVLRRNGGRDVHVHEVNRRWGVESVPFHDAQPDPFLENEHRRSPAN